MINIKRLKKQYRKIDWYQQAGAIKNLYIGYPWLSCFGFTFNHKRIPYFYKGISVYFRKDFFDIFFPYKTMYWVANFYLKEKNNKIKRLYDQWRTNDAERLRNFIQTYSGYLSELSDKDLIKIFKQFSQIYQLLWREQIFHDAFDAVADKLLEQALTKYSLKLSLDEIHILTAADELSWLQKEHLDLIGMSKRPGEMEQKLEEHARNFHWIYNDYAVIKKLGPQDFLVQLRKLMDNSKFRKEEEANLQRVLSIAQSRAKLIKKRKIAEEITNFTELLVIIAKWRDGRKSHTQMANGFLFEFVNEVSSRVKISVSDLEYLWPWEMSRVFKFKKQEVIFLHKSRFNGAFYYGNPKQEKVFYGQKAKDFFKFMQSAVASGKDISGQVAYPGIVRGRIRIVRSQQEFKKMKKGDILLAPNTRPEYVPIMKIAGAILSEEGGITSHSAIVSRELRKPCIVGVQGAIFNLKDGQLVEVDANKGVVRKI